MNKRSIMFYVVGFAMLLGVGLAVGVAIRENTHSSRRVLEMKHKDDIHAASLKLLRDVVTESRHSADSFVLLRQTMIRLRDGWPGFVSDGNYPYPYKSQDLLGSLYWEVAKEASGLPEGELRETLVLLLKSSAPESGAEQGLLDSYDYAIRKNGLQDVR